VEIAAGLHLHPLSDWDRDKAAAADAVADRGDAAFAAHPHPVVVAQDGWGDLIAQGSHFRGQPWGSLTGHGIGPVLEGVKLKECRENLKRAGTGLHRIVINCGAAGRKVNPESIGGRGAPGRLA